MTRGRVLIAEDEVTLAWVEQFNLESEGYEVRVAPDGRAVIDALESFEPDVLILDVMLPFLDGWSILANLRDMPNDRRPKVILVSATAGVVDRAKAEGLSVESVMSKPFDMDDLIDRVATLVKA
jgi:two-component system, OmpR family, alkaline phosphatase synthesis response regulator PhoP